MIAARENPHSGLICCFLLGCWGSSVSVDSAEHNQRTSPTHRVGPSTKSPTIGLHQVYLRAHRTPLRYVQTSFQQRQLLRGYELSKMSYNTNLQHKAPQLVSTRCTFASTKPPCGVYKQVVNRGNYCAGTNSRRCPSNIIFVHTL